MDKRKQTSSVDEHPAQSFDFKEQIVCDSYLTSEESDEDEIEYAYQCDFQKRKPQKPCNPSLLSDMLTNAQQNITEHHSCSIPIPSKNDTHLLADPLSESLKRNLEWQKTQDIMRKYDKTIIKKLQTDEAAYIDEFSRW